MRRAILRPVSTAPFSGGGDIYGIGQGLTAIFDNLPKLGVGLKSRIKETEATANANISQINAEKLAQTSIIEAQTQSDTKKASNAQKMIFVAFVGVFLIVVVIFKMRK